MVILQANIIHATRNRDFAMIEAQVALLVKAQPGQPPRMMSLRAHVPARGGNLRARLIADACQMVQHLHTLPIQRTRQAA